MKDMIQRMTDLENQGKKPLNESRRIAECPPEMAENPMTAPMDQGTPVSVNVNMSAAGKEHVEDLLSMMKSAGLDQAEPMKPDMMPMRNDIERLRSIVDEPEMEDEDDLEEYENEPDYEYSDHEKMTHDLSGGINRQKKSYADAEDGDNPMAVTEKEADPEIIAKVQELSKINDIDVLKKEVYDLVKNTKMNKAKKMQLMRNAESSRTVKNLIGLLWNTFVLGAENKHAMGSSWSGRFEDSETEMREADGVSDADRNPSIERSKYKSNTRTRKSSDSDNEKKDRERGLPMDDMSIAKRKKERAMGETSLEHKLKSKLYAALSEKMEAKDTSDKFSKGEKVMVKGKETTITVPDGPGGLVGVKDVDGDTDMVKASSIKKMKDTKED